MMESQEEEGGGGRGDLQQQQQEQEKKRVLEYDQRVRMEAILGCQHMKEVEQHLVRMPPPLLGAANHPDAQAVRAGIMGAAAAIVRSFSNVIQLLTSFPTDAPAAHSSPPPPSALSLPLPPSAARSAAADASPGASVSGSGSDMMHQHGLHSHSHSRGLMNAIAQLEAGSNAAAAAAAANANPEQQHQRGGGRPHAHSSPNNPESPMSTACTSDTPPPSPGHPGMLSPRLANQGLPPLPSPPLSSSPCHTPMSGMSDGSPVSCNFNVHNLSSLGILDMEATSTSKHQQASAAESEPESAAASADQRPVPKRRKFLPRWNIKLRAAGGESGNEAPPDDGFTWRKYGQKDILGSRFPRSYYRCTHKNELGCPAIKYVQKCDDDPSLFDVTYRGEHSCLAQIPPNPWFPFQSVASPMHNLAQQPYPPVSEPAAAGSSSLILNTAGGIQVGPSLSPSTSPSPSPDAGAVQCRVPFPLTTGNAGGSNLLLRPAFAQSPAITPRFGMPLLDPRAGVKSEQAFPPQAVVPGGGASIFPPNAVSLLSMLLQNAVKGKESGHGQHQHQHQQQQAGSSQMEEREKSTQQGLVSQGFSEDLTAALPRAGSGTVDRRETYVSSWVDSLPHGGYHNPTAAAAGGGNVKEEAEDMAVESSAESLPSPASSDAVSSQFRAPRALQPNTAGLSVVAPPRNPRAALHQQPMQQQQQQPGSEQIPSPIPFSIGLYPLDSPGSQQQIANAMSDYESYGNSLLFGGSQADQSKFM